MDNRYPKHAQISHSGSEFDGYVAASHEPHSISTNALELRDRVKNEATAPPNAYVSENLSSQERGILRGIIGLLQMTPRETSLHLYTTSEGVVKALQGKHKRKLNVDLLEDICRVIREKNIDFVPIYVTPAQLPRWVVLQRLSDMARAKRDEWLGRSSADR